MPATSDLLPTSSPSVAFIAPTSHNRGPSQSRGCSKDELTSQNGWSTYHPIPPLSAIIIYRFARQMMRTCRWRAVGRPSGRKPTANQRQTNCSIGLHVGGSAAGGNITALSMFSDEERKVSIPQPWGTLLSLLYYFAR